MDKEKARTDRKQYLARRRQNLIDGINNANMQNDMSSRRRNVSNISTSNADVHTQPHGENNSNVRTDLSSRKRKSNTSTSIAVEHAQSQDPESSTAAPRRGRPRLLGHRRC
ncbi:hypothetical protein CASFOL_036162 [Castilleja foliolosa]|uniref:Uncharacterized protein n=1 Tax=Castilleja foliolosa TaxID=1961234 RepID=A0ABD3BX43_9LAMI